MFNFDAMMTDESESGQRTKADNASGREGRRNRLECGSNAGSHLADGCACVINAEQVQPRAGFDASRGIFRASVFHT